WSFSSTVALGGSPANALQGMVRSTGWNPRLRTLSATGSPIGTLVASGLTPSTRSPSRTSAPGGLVRTSRRPCLTGPAEGSGTGAGAGAVAAPGAVVGVGVPGAVVAVPGAVVGAVVAAPVVDGGAGCSPLGAGMASISEPTPIATAIAAPPTASGQRRR